MSLHFTQRTLEDMLAMTQTASWELLISVMESTYYLSDVEQIDTIEELYQAKGEMDVLRFMKTLPDYISEAMDAV